MDKADRFSGNYGFAGDYATMFEKCAEELQEILDFDVENALESDPSAFRWPLLDDAVILQLLGYGPITLSKREALVLAARLLRAAAQ